MVIKKELAARLDAIIAAVLTNLDARLAPEGEAAKELIKVSIPFIHDEIGLFYETYQIAALPAMSGFLRGQPANTSIGRVTLTTESCSRVNDMVHILQAEMAAAEAAKLEPRPALPQVHFRRRGTLPLPRGRRAGKSS